MSGPAPSRGDDASRLNHRTTLGTHVNLIGWTGEGPLHLFLSCGQSFLTCESPRLRPSDSGRPLEAYSRRRLLIPHTFQRKHHRRANRRGIRCWPMKRCSHSSGVSQHPPPQDGAHRCCLVFPARPFSSILLFLAVVCVIGCDRLVAIDKDSMTASVAASQIQAIPAAEPGGSSIVAVPPSEVPIAKSAKALSPDRPAPTAASVVAPSSPAPLQITTAALPVGNVRTSYATTLVATGGVPPYSWSDTTGQIAPGLTLRSSTGTILGIPFASGTFSFTTRVRDAKASSSSITLSLQIAPGPLPAISDVAPQSGSVDGGTLVTISGKNFQPGAKVQFGGSQACSVQVISPTQIVAVTPAEPRGSVPITVNAPDGQIAAAANPFNFAGPTASSLRADVIVDRGATVSQTGVGLAH